VPPLSQFLVLLANPMGGGLSLGLLVRFAMLVAIVIISILEFDHCGKKKIRKIVCIRICTELIRKLNLNVI
jgi:hypothetical protein